MSPLTASQIRGMTDDPWGNEAHFSQPSGYGRSKQQKCEDREREKGKEGRRPKLPATTQMNVLRTQSKEVAHKPRSNAFPLIRVENGGLEICFHS